MKTPRIRLLLGLIFSLLVLGWAVLSLDWRAIWQAITEVRFEWVVLGIVLNFVAFITRTWRWSLLLYPNPYTFANRFDALLLGQAANYISPIRVGDLLRAYLFGNITGENTVRVLGTIALEKLWDMAMLLLFSIGVSWFFPLPEWLQGSVRGIMIAILVVGCGIFIGLWQQPRLTIWVTRIGDLVVPRLRHRLVDLTQRIFDGFTSLRHTRSILGVVLWSVATWLVGGLLNYVIFLALDLSLPLTAAFLLLVVLQIGVAVPSLPGRIGVFQGICVVVLALFDVPYVEAFSYGLILHLVVFLPPIITAAIISLRTDINLRQLPQL